MKVLKTKILRFAHNAIEPNQLMNFMIPAWLQGWGISVWSVKGKIRYLSQEAEVILGNGYKISIKLQWLTN